MTVTATIVDNSNGLPLPGASVTLISASGTNLNAGVTADNNGQFMFTDIRLDTGAKLMISNVGYTTLVVDPNIIVASGTVGLDVSPDLLATATVTATRKTNYTPWLLGGGALFLLASTSKKKRGRAVGAVNVNWGDLAIKGGIAVGAYVLVVKPIMDKLGLFKSASEQATLDAQKKALADAQTKQAGTYSADQYTAWANDIYSIAMAGSNPLSFDDQSRIVNNIVNVNNMTDLQLLISAFGVKKIANSFWSTCQWLGFNCLEADLPTFVKSVLDSQHVNNLNLYLSGTNINYQF